MVSRAVAHAEANRLGFLSCVIRYDGKSLAEELVALVQNRDLVVSTRSFGGGAPDSAFGVGQFMLVRATSMSPAAGTPLSIASHRRFRPGQNRASRGRKDVGRDRLRKSCPYADIIALPICAACRPVNTARG